MFARAQRFAAYARARAAAGGVVARRCAPLLFVVVSNAMPVLADNIEWIRYHNAAATPSHRLYCINAYAFIRY